MDEPQLISALQGRDPAALHHLIESCGERLLRSAFLLCGNEADAKDLTQETFLQALRSIDRFHQRSSLYTWLHAILLNLTRHYHRDRKRIVYDEDLARRDVETHPEEQPHQADACLASAALADALASLSDAHRVVLVLRFYEEMKIEEIARLLGLSLGTVKSRLHYAILEMQKRMPSGLNLFGSSGTKNTATS